MGNCAQLALLGIEIILNYPALFYVNRRAVSVQFLLVLSLLYPLAGIEPLVVLVWVGNMNKVRVAL